MGASNPVGMHEVRSRTKHLLLEVHPTFTQFINWRREFPELARLYSFTETARKLPSGVLSTDGCGIEELVHSTRSGLSTTNENR